MSILALQGVSKGLGALAVTRGGPGHAGRSGCRPLGGYGPDTVQGACLSDDGFCDGDLRRADVIGGIGMLPRPVSAFQGRLGRERGLADFGPLCLVLFGMIGAAIILFVRCDLWGTVIQRTGGAPLMLRQRAPLGRKPERSVEEEKS